jgi:hydrogenase nickel incorporation protein HypA/HybF
MHDSAMARGLIAAAERAAREAGAPRVRRVRVRVGALAGISADHLRHHFEAALAGTSLEGSLLTVETGPDGPGALDDPGAEGVLLLGLDVEDC